MRPCLFVSRVRLGPRLPGKAPSHETHVGIRRSSRPSQTEDASHLTLSGCPHWSVLCAAGASIASEEPGAGTRKAPGPSSLRSVPTRATPEDRGRRASQPGDRAADRRDPALAGPLESGTGHITGTVTDAGGHPLADITFVISLHRRRVLADGAGRKREVGLPPTVRTTSTIWPPRRTTSPSATVTLPLRQRVLRRLSIFETAADVEVAERATVSGIEAVLASPAGHVTGTVTNAAGDPVPDITVLAYAYESSGATWTQIGRNMAFTRSRRHVSDWRPRDRRLPHLLLGRCRRLPTRDLRR